MTAYSIRIMDDSVSFEVKNHAGNREACAMCSMICNMVTCACDRYGIAPTADEDGYLSYEIDRASDALIGTFRDAKRCFDAVRNEFPKFVLCE